MRITTQFPDRQTRSMVLLTVFGGPSVYDRDLYYPGVCGHHDKDYKSSRSGSVCLWGGVLEEKASLGDGE
jgi:hypothetical protein